MNCRDTVETRTLLHKLKDIDRQIRCARKNASRQRIREMQGKRVNVASSFWERVEQDYRCEKREVELQLRRSQSSSKEVLK